MLNPPRTENTGVGLADDDDDVIFGFFAGMVAMVALLSGFSVAPEGGEILCLSVIFIVVG